MISRRKLLGLIPIPFFTNAFKQEKTNERQGLIFWASNPIRIPKSFGRCTTYQIVARTKDKIAIGESVYMSKDGFVSRASSGIGTRSIGIAASKVDEDGYFICVLSANAISPTV